MCTWTRCALRCSVTLISVWVSIVPMLCQSPKPAYQLGTILSVRHDENPAGKGPPAKGYDISLKVGHTIYVVLYIPPPGTYGAQYSAGHQLLVLVGDDTITFNDVLGKSRSVPILSRKTEVESSK